MASFRPVFPTQWYLHSGPFKFELHMCIAMLANGPSFLRVKEKEEKEKEKEKEEEE